MTSEQHSGQSDTAHPGNLCVVGIGASAGGLDALNELFGALPEKTGMAFVIVQHLDPDHDTLLPELLTNRTGMSVVLASEGMELLPDTVYIIPPGSTLTTVEGRLHTGSFEEPRGQRTPIDTFFRSLAQNHRENAIGIILSGNGSDGTLGIKEIKECGGMALAQDPASAQYQSMPLSAIQTGLMDFVLVPEDMPQKLQTYDASKALLRPEQIDDKSDLIDSISTITAILRRVTGHDFRAYRRSTLARRILRRMNMLDVRDVAGYVALLQKDATEAESLFRDFLISVTHFFRDPEAFKVLATDVIPALVKENREMGLSSIRVWVPGCATGEEAYSIGMLLLDYCERHDIRMEIKIFATDIDLDALEVARRGSYPEGIVAQVEAPLLDRYFTRQGTRYRVSKGLRDIVIFSLHNLVKDPPFSRLDLISCRNLLIYLQTEEQRRLMRVLHYALRRQGFLFLGSSENAAAHSGLFRVTSKKHRIFRQREGKIGPPAHRHSTETTRPFYQSFTSPTAEQPEGSTQGRQIIERIILREYSPTCVVVDEGRQILFSSGKTSDYLRIPEGNISTNVIDMARRGLRLDLRAALHEAFRSRRTVEKGPVMLEMANGETHRITIVVRPIDEIDQGEMTLLVLFNDLGPIQVEEGEESDRVDETHPVVLHLEDELRSTREQLQTTIEELETTNEELKSSNEELLSMNEELQSSNEELQTSKEEIQSINEELYAVNAELNQKIEEVNQTNSDLQNLLQCTQIPTLFVNGRMEITRLTPEAGDLFRIIDGDVGRRIGDVRTKFGEVNIEGYITQVLETLTPYEKEVSVQEQGSSHIMRILPYRTVNNVIDGVVITFSNITFLRRAEAGERYLQAMFEYVPEGIMVVDAQSLTTQFISREGYRMLGREAEYYNEPLGEQYSPSTVLKADGVTEYDISELPIMRALKKGEIVSNEKMYFQSGEKLIPLITTAAPVLDDQGKTIAGVVTWRDISDIEATQQELSRSSEDYRIIASELESLYKYMPIGLAVIDEDLCYVRINKYMAEVHGMSIDDHIGQPVFDLMPEIRETVEPVLQRVFETGEPAIELDLTTPVLKGEQGSSERNTSYWSASYFRMPSAEGDHFYVVSIVRNVTQKREAEIALEESREELRRLNEGLEERVEKRTAQVRSLSAALALAERSERRRLSFLLHDDLQQILFGLEMKFQLLLQQTLATEGEISKERVQRELRDLGDTLLQAIQVTRTLSVELNPPLEHDSGVEPALQWIAGHMKQQYGLDVELEVEEDLRMPNVDMRALMVQLVRELLFNVVKHSGGLKARLQATSTLTDCITIVVEDQGEGFDAEAISGGEPGGLGLFSIRERVLIVGGSVDISSTTGKGTTITVTLPVFP